MTVLVVGTGAREHALAARVAESSQVDRVTVMPGNAGIARDQRLACVDAQPTAESIQEQHADLIVVGQEHLLVRGLVDRLRERGRLVLGPGETAAALEGSKEHAKRFMQQQGVQTPESRACTSPEEARRAVDELGLPVAIKPDGLSRSQGVVVVESLARADAAIAAIMTERLYGDAGSTVLVERAVQGPEASITLLMDETAWLRLPTVMTYKQIGEGGSGANTGGMGAVSPNPLLDDELLRRIESEIVEPVVAGIRSAGWHYRGFLDIGIVIADRQPAALEFNVRLGDPDAQVMMPLIDGDLAALLAAAAAGDLKGAIESAHYAVRRQAACAVVAASGGYPGSYERGNRVVTDTVHADGELARHSRLYFAGVAGDTEAADESLVTTRGRVLTAAAIADDAATARRFAYTRLMTTHFDGMQYRRDIGGPDISATIVEEGTTLLPQFQKRGGLLPVVVQDVKTMNVLMLGYANRRAFEATLDSGFATFWSTSRSELWMKGETSGNRLPIREIRIDCDQDAILYLVEAPAGGVCHTRLPDGTHRMRCFYRRLDQTNELIHDDPH